MDKIDQLPEKMALFWRSIWISLNSTQKWYSGLILCVVHVANTIMRYEILKNKNLKLRKEPNGECNKPK